VLWDPQQRGSHTWQQRGWQGQTRSRRYPREPLFETQARPVLRSANRTGAA